MIFEETNLKSSFVIFPKTIKDNRGEFSRFFCKQEFKKIGLEKEFVQINHSYNLLKGTIRGMHFQKSPFEESKLIRCVRGSVLDVIIDLRPESNTYLKHFAVELSADNKKMIYIPTGFAHGFQTLQENTELIYHHTEYYKPEFETGIRYNDPQLGIKWPLTVTGISDKDKNYSPVGEK